MPTRAATQPLTVFGATVLTLMIRRGIRTVSELSALLAAGGYDYTPERISNWLHGRHSAHSAFPTAVREVLRLTEVEASELAMAVAYGQEERITLDWLAEK